MARAPALKIISGGQTGADRAALDVALELKLPCGGWCPADRRAEDGPIDKRYPLVSLAKGGYRERTRQNVIDSDGTVILSFGALTGGSKLTAGFARQLKKPCLIIDARTATPTEAAVMLAVFLLRHRIQTLNIAGPRGSGQPKIYSYVSQTLKRLLQPQKRKRARISTKSHE
jgi:hypothetical protein